MQDAEDKSVLAIPNIRYFIAFRVFFNARFYYPVFTILFLDFGLSLEQFALLNVVWAATIVLLEVPSGALADIFGRKNLLVLTGILMVLEMTFLGFAPRGNPDLLFVIFLANRILSGTAEAAASGADEALAYDTLKNLGLNHLWGKVLEREMRLRALTAIIAMTLGALVYDPDFVQKVFNLLGVSIRVTQSMTLRAPILLTLIMAILTLVVASRMKESMIDTHGPSQTSETGTQSVAAAFKLTFAAGRWIGATPFALAIIASGLVFDNVIRMVLTLSSQYYRLIQLPEATFGLIGAGMGAMGLVIPRLAHRLTQRRSPRFNLGLMAVMAFTGLAGMTFFIPWLGLLPMMLVVGGMYMLNFFVSHYLNRITSSSQRATVLSFKGLSFNLAYGLAGILYATLIAAIRGRLTPTQVALGKSGLENAVFRSAMDWFPWYFIVIFALLVIFTNRILRNSQQHRQPG